MSCTAFDGLLVSPQTTRDVTFMVDTLEIVVICSVIVLVYVLLIFGVEHAPVANVPFDPTQ